MATQLSIKDEAKQRQIKALLNELDELKDLTEDQTGFVSAMIVTLSELTVEEIKESNHSPLGLALGKTKGKYPYKVIRQLKTDWDTAANAFANMMKANSFNRFHTEVWKERRAEEEAGKAANAARRRARQDRQTRTALSQVNSVSNEQLAELRKQFSKE